MQVSSIPMFKYDGDVSLLITASILKYEKYTNEYLLGNLDHTEVNIDEVCVVDNACVRA